MEYCGIRAVSVVWITLVEALLYRPEKKTPKKKTPHLNGASPTRLHLQPLVQSLLVNNPPHAQNSRLHKHITTRKFGS